LGENNPLFGAIRVLPLQSLNAIMVVTPRAAYLDEIRYWVEQFDRPDINSNQAQLYVYKVKNGSADHLAELLNGIYGNGVLTQRSNNGGSTGVAPGMNTVGGINGNVNNNFVNRNSAFGNNNFGNNGFGSNGFGNTFGGGLNGGIGGGIGGGMMGGLGGMSQNGNNQGPGVTTTMLGDTVRVMADHINNTLLIHATPAEYRRIESSLKRLDVQRAQVLIEASIIEVTLNNDLQYGLEWAFNNNIKGRLGTSTLGNPSSTGGNFSTSDGTRDHTGFTWTLTNPGGALGVTLSALADKSLLKVISSPSLLVLDNQTAAIQVGTQVPTSTGSTTYGTVGPDGSPVVNNQIQYQSTGVMLGVTPSVTAGDLVTMDINQMVTDPVATSTPTLTPAFQQRQINTAVAVRSGETVVLGGLIKDSSTSGISGIPGLSSIPLIGALFGTHSNIANRTELLVVITPRVLRSDEDARAVSREMRDRMRGLTTADLPVIHAGPRTR
jgi:general secretion pathway protein D